MAEPVVCARCGLRADVDDPAGRLGWLWSADGACYCPACSRMNVRAIEAKLDEEYW
jgi:hypothetical protein